MEEKNENDTSEYTGEYGNAIDGEYREENTDSTYRMSYVNQDKSENQKQEIPEDQPVFTQAPTQNYYQENNNQYNNPQGFNGYTPQNGFTGQMSKPPKKEDKPGSFGKKLLITIACAVVFGLVASVCFTGVNYILSKQELFENDDVKVSKTTDNESKVSVDSDDKNVSKDDSSKVTTNKNSSDVATIAEQAMPAVVAITSTTQGTDYFDLFGQYYQGQDTTSSGTGFIVGQNDKELLIATNNHVIEDAKTISVQFIDGEIYEAQQKGADSINDLAVVAVPVSKVKKETMNKIKIADLGNSDDTKVGEMVIAIGNALGYGQSVTVGYVSAKDREIETGDENNMQQGATHKIKAIQTDAAINPGNSGGALINMQGQVIGINSAKIASSSVEGVGYAIPISVATPIIDDLMNKEVLTDDEKGYLGISGSEVTEAASAYNMPYGVYVKEVAKGGAAQKGGIQAGDIITAINKSEVTTMTSLQEKVQSIRKGTKIEITIKRSSNGSYVEKKVKVTLQGKESLDSLSK